jgi:hypothetical protein
VILLPSGVLETELKTPWVLEVGRQGDGLVACFAGDLDAEVPCIEGDKGESFLGVEDVFFGKGVDALDCFAETACVLDVVPRQACRTGCTARLDWR